MSPQGASTAQNAAAVIFSRVDGADLMKRACDRGDRARLKGVDLSEMEEDPDEGDKQDQSTGGLTSLPASFLSTLLPKLPQSPTPLPLTVPSAPIYPPKSSSSAPLPSYSPPNGLGSAAAAADRRLFDSPTPDRLQQDSGADASTVKASLQLCGRSNPPAYSPPNRLGPAAAAAGPCLLDSPTPHRLQPDSGADACTGKASGQLSGRSNPELAPLRLSPAPPSSSATPAHPSASQKHSCDDSETGSEEISHCLPGKKQKLQDPRNRRRCAKRALERMKSGVPQGQRLAQKRYVLPAQGFATNLCSDKLPIAVGGYVGVDGNWYGAKARRELEMMMEKGFQLVEWQKGKSIPLTDSEQRVMVCMLDGPDDPGYEKAVSEMTESILKAGEATNWARSEKKHKRGDFPALARGISYGKGQREPMRLVGERQLMMDGLLKQDCFRRVAGFQSSAFATWYPRNYAEHLRLNAELEQKLPHLKRNFDNSVYLCMTVNFGPSTWTHIHTDSKNDVRIPCAITTGGTFNHKAGGHLILWDFKLILEFPPGATILLPSALIRHSNLPVAVGETRISVTQYTAGGVRRWLEYGGRTEDEFCMQDPEGFTRAWAKRRENYKEGISLFCTLEELNLHAV